MRSRDELEEKPRTLMTCTAYEGHDSGLIPLRFRPPSRGSLYNMVLSVSDSRGFCDNSERQRRWSRTAVTVDRSEPLYHGSWIRALPVAVGKRRGAGNVAEYLPSEGLSMPISLHWH